METPEYLQHDSLDREQLLEALPYISDLVQYIHVPEDRFDWYGDVDRLLGYQPGEFPRTFSGWWEFVHPEDQERLQPKLEEITRGGLASWSERYRIRAGDGSYRHWLDQGKVISFLEDGGSRELLGGIIDETAQVRAREELERTVTELQALREQLEGQSGYLRGEIESSQDFGEITAISTVMSETMRQAEIVADTNATVLLHGETGAGKEIVARHIHRHSPRGGQALIKVDCGTLPAGLIESELFGHEKGAFTGAHKAKVGRFELAHRGTVFLDEIGELPLELQAKLLRVLDEGVLRRVGGRAEKTVDVRVIAATNRDLRQEMREGRFRSDLYYRLSVFAIEVPPLRDRPEDIPQLVSTFVTTYAQRLGRRVDRISDSCMHALVAYDWPGNVRELRNVIERSVILCQDGVLRVERSLLGVEGEESPTPALLTSGPLELDLQAVERARILHALEQAEWKIKGEGNAASQLGVTPSGLRARMKRLGITRPE
jgi:transcriptional regulator with GAF, ATPase, and Fis domain